LFFHKCSVFYRHSLPAATVRARHHTILPAIGALPEEQAAYARLTLLRWLAPLAVLLTSLLDLLLVGLYMSYAHPWRGILETSGPRGEEAAQQPQQDEGGGQNEAGEGGQDEAGEDGDGGVESSRL
jgi:hypothetical protein